MAFMNDELKQRLVGAGVLLILAGLLWPLLFDFDERLSLEAPSSEIPPMAKVAKVEIAQPKPRKPITKILPSTAKPKSKVAIDGKAQNLSTLLTGVPTPPPIAGKPQYANTVSDEQRPRLDKQGIPVSFVVQVGTFKNWSNANGLRDKLLTKKLKAYIKPVSSLSPGPYTVLVGPVLTFANAKQIKSTVGSQFQLNDALIKRFRSLQ